MKKFVSLLALALIVPLSSHADQKSVECDLHEDFVKNDCSVCYTREYSAVESAGWWTSEIKDIEIPWKHSGGNLSDLVYEDEQTKPEIRTTLKYQLNPSTTVDAWTFHNDVIWVPLQKKELFIDAGDEINFYTLNQGVSITVKGDNFDNWMLFYSPMQVRDFDQDKSEESPPRANNVCVRAEFSPVKKDAQTIGTVNVADLLTVDQNPAPVLNTAAVIENSAPVSSVTDTMSTLGADPVVSQEPNFNPDSGVTKDTVVLNSAPEMNKPMIITKEQTNTQTGPIHWILVLISLALAYFWKFSTIRTQ